MCVCACVCSECVCVCEYVCVRLCVCVYVRLVGACTLLVSAVSTSFFLFLLTVSLFLLTSSKLCFSFDWKAGGTDVCGASWAGRGGGGGARDFFGERKGS